jgi:hypothetical protein
VLIDIGPEQPADQRNVANNGSFIFCLLHVLAHQTSDHHGLAIPDAHVRGHFARAENGLVNHIRGQKNRRGY